MVPMCFIFTR